MKRSWSRRRFIQAAVGGVTATALTRPPAAAQRRRRPNVVYLFSDEHRWQSMSFTELPQVYTRNMQRLAREGMEFTHCISNYPVCSPYRAMLQTGRWPYQTGIIDNNIKLSANETTIAKVFRDAGYATGYIGKWHLGGVRAEPFGYDESLIWTNTNTHWNQSKYHPAEGPPVQPEGYNATLMTDQALAFIERNRDRPFFLMVSWNPPHSNFTDAPPEQKARYPEGSLPYRPNVTGRRPVFGRVYRGYHAHVSAIDAEIGRVLRKLDELNLSRDTMVIYTSDHGSMLRSHSVGGKRQPYEESIRVPFLIRWPGVVPAGRKSNALFGTIDIVPTVCSLAGLRVPDTCVGLDFADTVRGKKDLHPDSQFLMHISKKHASGGEKHPAPLFRGLRTERYTFALYPDRPWCLFDNRNDPYQTKNLIDDPGYTKIRRDLYARLQEWVRRAEDPIQLPAL